PSGCGPPRRPSGPWCTGTSTALRAPMSTTAAGGARIARRSPPVAARAAATSAPGSCPAPRPQAALGPTPWRRAGSSTTRCGSPRPDGQPPGLVSGGLQPAGLCQFVGPCQAVDDPEAGPGGEFGHAHLLPGPECLPELPQVGREPVEARVLTLQGQFVLWGQRAEQREYLCRR